MRQIRVHKQLEPTPRYIPIEAQSQHSKVGGLGVCSPQTPYTAHLLEFHKLLNISEQHSARKQSHILSQLLQTNICTYLNTMSAEHLGGSFRVFWLPRSLRSPSYFRLHRGRCGSLNLICYLCGLLGGTLFIVFRDNLIKVKTLHKETGNYYSQHQLLRP